MSTIIPVLWCDASQYVLCVAQPVPEYLLLINLLEMFLVLLFNKEARRAPNHFITNLRLEQAPDTLPCLYFGENLIFMKCLFLTSRIQVSLFLPEA